MHSIVNAAFAAACLLTTAAAAPRLSRYTWYEMPSFMSGPCDLTPGPDGAIWVQDQLAAKIARIDQLTGNVTELDIPYTNPPQDVVVPNIGGKTPLACAIQPGEDGLIYASAGTRNQFVIVNPKTMKVKVITPPPVRPLGNLQPFNDVYRAKNGMYLTSSTDNLIRFYDYKKGFTKFWTIPTPFSLPLGCYVTDDGAVWFAEFGVQSSKIGRLNATTGEFKEFQMPLELNAPAVIRVQRGRKLYFTAAVGNGMGEIDIYDYKVRRFANPVPLSVPGVNIQDSKGIVWSSSINQNILGKLNPKTGIYRAIRLPVRIPSSNGFVLPTTTISVTYDPITNSIFYTTDISNIVGRIQLLHR